MLFDFLRLFFCRLCSLQQAWQFSGQLGGIRNRDEIHHRTQAVFHGKQPFSGLLIHFQICRLFAVHGKLRTDIRQHLIQISIACHRVHPGVDIIILGTECHHNLNLTLIIAEAERFFFRPSHQLHRCAALKIDIETIVFRSVKCIGRKTGNVIRHNHALQVCAGTEHSCSNVIRVPAVRQIQIRSGQVNKFRRGRCTDHRDHIVIHAVRIKTGRLGNRLDTERSADAVFFLRQGFLQNLIDRFIRRELPGLPVHVVPLNISPHVLISGIIPEIVIARIQITPLFDIVFLRALRHIEP